MIEETSGDEVSGESEPSERNKPPSAVPSSAGHSAFTTKLFYFRIVVFSSLLITAVFCGCVSYFLLKHYEDRRYEDSFISLSAELGNSVEFLLSKIMQSNIQASVYLGSLHKRKEDWPFVLTADFDTVYSLLEKVSHITMLSFAPIFNATMVNEFNDYYNEAYENMTGRSSDLRVQTRFGNYSAYPPSLVAPIINSEPITDSLLLDVYNDFQFCGRLESVINCVDSDTFANFHNADRCSSFSGVIENPIYAPVLNLLSPLYSLNSPSDMVGVVISAVFIQDLFQEAVSQHQTGIDILVYSNNDDDGTRDNFMTFSVGEYAYVIPFVIFHSSNV